MAKQKTKLKADRTDIVCRIVTALLAIAVPFVTYFMNMIYYVVESTVFGLLAQLQGNSDDDGSTYGYLGFHSFFKEGGFYELIKGRTESKESLTALWETLEPVRAALIVTVVFLALIVITALAIFFVSIFSNSKKVPLFMSWFGLACAVGMFISFRYVSNPLTDGTISLASFFDSVLAKLILPYVASISVLNLSSAWVMILVIFTCIAVWTGAQLIITVGDKPKAKKAK